MTRRTWSNLRRAVAACNASQVRHDRWISEEKLAAKKRGVELLAEHAPGVRDVLDVGGEDFYADLLPGEVTAVNLPDDMHDMPYQECFDAALAMHVLEHSPAPLLVLLNIHDALRLGGVLYVATPPPVPPFDEMPSHWTVMPAATWERLICLAGFTVVHREQGVFGDYEAAVEDRWVARK